MYTVNDFFSQHGPALGLTIAAGREGLRRRITVPEVHRPGLSLTGYLKSYARKRIIVLGRIEMDFLKDLPEELRIERLSSALTSVTPAVIVARHLRPLPELVQLCEERDIPLFRTPKSTMSTLSRVVILLTDEFAPCTTCHGTLVEVFGVGVLIQGDSSVGKSEAALGLVERGHRLISDDVVRVKCREGAWLEGSGVELTRHHMEVRGIGIINVAHLYGAVCVRDQKVLDLVVQLEQWDDNHFYDRLGLEEKFCKILGLQVPFHVLPVKPGRDVVLLLETIALNHRLKEMGYNSARDFSSRLTDMLQRKSRRGNGIVIESHSKSQSKK